MHFHLPKPLHGWREFAGEVGIIVVGVLIALSAEQVVETLHRQQQVHDAEAAMRLELQTDDGPQAVARAAIERCLAAQLDALQVAVEGDLDRAQVHKLAAAYSPLRRTWDEQAWRTATASQAAGQMPPSAMLRWSTPYDVIPGLSSTNQKEQLDLAMLRAGERSSGTASQLEKDRWLVAIENLRHDNQSMAYSSHFFLLDIKDVGAAVSVQSQKEVVGEMRSHFGDCVRSPTVGLRPNGQLDFVSR